MKIFLGKKILFSVYMSLALVCCLAQAGRENITAEQIIQRAIDSAGGDQQLKSMKNVELISQIISPKNDTLSICVKRMNGDKYLVSSLSLSHANTSGIYNKGRAVTITDQQVEQIHNQARLEELQLQSYLSPEYGYKQLGYHLERQNDQHFQHFDCYTVLVSSPLGRTTTNYYDKKTGRLIMIIYPNGNKSVFTDFYTSKGITCASKVLMVDTLGAITASTLTHINYDPNLDSNWFAIPKKGIYQTPTIFKTGTFKYINSNAGARIIRDATRQTEITASSSTEYRIEWRSPNEYLLSRLKDFSQSPTNDNIEYIQVRILSWTGKKYYCHYLTSDKIGGACAFEKLTD